MIHKDFDKVFAGKEEDISRLRDHNQKLIVQIKKTKDKFQCSPKVRREDSNSPTKVTRKGRRKLCHEEG